MDTLQLFSRDFLIGFVGMLIGTGYLAQYIKAIPFVAPYAMTHKKFCGMACTLVAAFICALAYQVAASVMSDNPFQWATIPATTIVYATASSFAYEWFIKKATSDASLPSA